MRTYLRSAGLAAMSLFAMAALADDIGPGSKAPPLEIKSWIKGSPVKSLDPSKLYVVEFWATWCGPCKTSIPHLTELAHKNKDVTFIGVSIWEDDKDGNIQKFVADMADKMDYNVAYSGNQTGMAQSWMAAAGQNGIPSAFVIKNGLIAWVGHPMELEGPLAEIKAGTFDAAAFKAKFEKSVAANRAQIALNKEITDAVALYDAGKAGEAKKRLGDIVAKHPEAQGSADMIQFGWLAKDDPKAWEKAARDLAASKDQEKIMQLCSFAYRAMSGKDRNVEQGRLALGLAREATENKDFNVLQYAAACYTASGDIKEALDVVNLEISILPTTPYKDNAQLKAALDKQRADLEAKLKGKG